MEALCYGADRQPPFKSGWTSPNEPPLPKKPHKFLGVFLGIAVLLFCSALLLYWTYTYHVSTTQPTSIVRFVPVTPTQNATVTANVPTLTPLPIINTAQDIYTLSTAAGIAMGNEEDVAASWWHQCCSYDPANGAQSFQPVEKLNC